MEYLLYGLIRRHCNFHVVFFERHRSFCVPQGVVEAKRSKYLLARSVIRRHLQVNLQQVHPQIKVETFQSDHDLLFRKYLEATGIYFVMCHDGANVLPMSLDATATSQNEKTVEAREKHRKLIFRSLIFRLINQGYNVALINGLEFLDTKVRTTSLSEY